MDMDDFVQEIDKNIEWFCDKVIEPYPIDKQSKDDVMKRMITLGWLRESTRYLFSKCWCHRLAN